MKRLALALAIFLLSTSMCFGAIWTETFDDGVGRLNQTNGPGDEWFTWDSVTQSIDATFYRGHTYERFASLGDTYIVGNSILGFSAVITPLEIVNGSGAAVGFINSDSVNTDNRCTVLFSTGESLIKSGIDEGSSGSIPFNAGSTYFVQFLLDGHADKFYLDVYEGTGTSGVYMGSISSSLGSSYASLEIDALGLTNRLSYTIPYQTPVRMMIDNLSYTIPEPATLLLAVLGGLFMERRNH